MTLRLAHRGDWRGAPENSLAALLAALEVPGCDGVEFDVRPAAGGIPVLSHDPTLDRTHARSDRVEDLSLEAVARLGIPTLAEVMTALPASAFLDVEVKGDPGAETVDVLLAGRGPAPDRAVVSSFVPAAIARVRRLAPGWSCWLNARDLAPATIALARDLGCRGISAPWRAIDEPEARRVGEAGLTLSAWTVRRRPTFERLTRLGVVAVCVEGRALGG